MTQLLFHIKRNWRNTNQTDCAWSAKQVTLSFRQSQRLWESMLNTHAPREGETDFPRDFF